MSATDEQLELVMKRNGIVYPDQTLAAFKLIGPIPKVGFSLAACCAVLDNETGGGENVWGHDPWDEEAYPKGIAHPAGPPNDPVTQWTYTQYKEKRDAGMQPQGCGPCQLTDASLQIEAEKLGGCWVPQHNMTIGFRFLSQLFLEHGSAEAGFAAYNGSGPDAEEYGVRAAALADEWQARFNAI
jgi:hypothetical protein